MNFIEAFEALQQGKMVRRHTWPSAHLFIFRQVPSLVKKDVVPMITSLPEAVKKEFARLFKKNHANGIDYIYFQDQLALVTHTHSIIGYSPSVADCFAQDWVIIEPVNNPGDVDV